LNLTIAIAVPTYRRPVELARLIASLRPEIESQSKCRIYLVVVDNDPAGSAQPVARSAEFFAVRYVIEPKPGISSARNTAVANALDSDVILFLDDDELVQAGWLDSLVKAYKRYDADLVAGPVRPILPTGAPEYLRKSGIFDRSEHADGSRIPEAGAGNLLICTHLFTDRQQIDWFRVDLGLTGGEDAELTRRFSQEGAKIVWASQAVVLEPVSSDRVSLGWLANRYRRIGAVDLKLTASTTSRKVLGALGGLVRIMSSAPILAFHALVLRRLHARSFRRFFRGIGYLEYAFGFVHREYGRS